MKKKGVKKEKVSKKRASKRGKRAPRLEKGLGWWIPAVLLDTGRWQIAETGYEPVQGNKREPPPDPIEYFDNFEGGGWVWVSEMEVCPLVDSKPRSEEEDDLAQEW